MVDPLRGSIVLVALLMSVTWCAQEHIKLDKIKLDRNDLASKQRGAALFFNYCSSCHSLKFTRYDAIATGLKIFNQDGQLDKEAVKKYLHPTSESLQSPILPAIDLQEVSQWYGKAPPDLTLESRVRGNNWIYTYMRSFYKDESRPFGVNNLVYPNVGMPHVLVNMQGLKTPIKDGAGHIIRLESEDTLKEQLYDKAIYDLVNFLDYVAEPHKQDRKRIGVYTLLFLSLLCVFSYMYYKELWKEVD